MPDEYQQMRDEFERLEGVVINLGVAMARIEGEMIYIRRSFDVHERLEASEVAAALEVRKTAALERIRNTGAEQNHRRELVLKAMAILTGLGAIIGAILGS